MAFCRESNTKQTTIEIELPDGTKKQIGLDPGEAYGRGKYNSTMLCIEAMEDIFKSRNVESVIDVGSGTGILSICAVLLGAKSVFAVDVDPVAVEETKTNVNKNDVSEYINIVYDSVSGIEDKFDLVVANLGITQIFNLSANLSSKLKEDALLLISGIWFSSQKKNVEKEFTQLGLNLKKELTDGAWFVLIFSNI